MWEMKRPITNGKGQTYEQWKIAYAKELPTFEKPSVTVDMVVLAVADIDPESHREEPQKELQVLLIKRDDWPCLGQWALPGGFVGMDEGLRQAAGRELEEETSIEPIHMEQLYSFGDDPDRDERTRVIPVAYLSLIDSTGQTLRPGDDAAEAAWFTLTVGRPYRSELPAENGYIREKRMTFTLTRGHERITSTVVTTLPVLNGFKGEEKRRVLSSLCEVLDEEGVVIKTGPGLAFDHALMIAYGLERLRKIEWTDIFFALLPPLFTLADVRQIWHLVLGEEPHDTALRRYLLDQKKMILPTNQYRRGRGHKPAQLFRYNVDWDAQTW